MQTNPNSPAQAKKDFAEWASLFSGEIFVKLAAYLDDGGSHDRTSKEVGSKQIVLTGWVDRRDDWAKFCGQWQSVLDKYSAPYFHFVEWA